MMRSSFHSPQKQKKIKTMSDCTFWQDPNLLSLKLIWMTVVQFCMSLCEGNILSQYFDWELDGC